MGRHCPYCNQILPEYRLDVPLTPFKAHIFDLVRDAGPEGIAWDVLFALAYEDAARDKRARNTLKVHICQINARIRDSGLRIRGHGHKEFVPKLGANAVYRLERIE